VVRGVFVNNDERLIYQNRIIMIMIMIMMMMIIIIIIIIIITTKLQNTQTRAIQRSMLDC